MAIIKKVETFVPSTINNELHYTINNSIRNNLRPVSYLLGLIRLAKSRETAVVIKPSGVKYIVLKRLFVGKVEKFDTAKSSQPNVSDIVSLL